MYHLMASTEQSFCIAAHRVSMENSRGVPSRRRRTSGSIVIVVFLLIMSGVWQLESQKDELFAIDVWKSKDDFLPDFLLGSFLAHCEFSVRTD